MNRAEPCHQHGLADRHVDGGHLATIGPRRQSMEDTWRATRPMPRAGMLQLLFAGKRRSVTCWTSQLIRERRRRNGAGTG
jgi:hypothetical protein